MLDTRPCHLRERRYPAISGRSRALPSGHLNVLSYLLSGRSPQCLICRVADHCEHRPEEVNVTGSTEGFVSSLIRGNTTETASKSDISARPDET